MFEKFDVTPPGREAQVRALKEKPGIENPYAVAWASYNKDDGPPWMGAKCDQCGQEVPVMDGAYDAHMMGAMMDDADVTSLLTTLCDGSGAKCRYDTIERHGGKWVLLSRSTGEVIGTHATRSEAEAQERAVQAAKHSRGQKSDDVPRVRRWERLDFAPGELPRARKTVDGFWQVAGRVARTGVQEYRDSAGGVRRELRLPEDVSASLPTFALQPLTNDHPPQMVTPENVKQYIAGAVGDARLDGKWVTAPLTIYAADAIAAAQEGRVQLSVGYSCRLEDVGGEWEGQIYDSIQRDIVVNHVALVDFARAGSEARIRLDAGDAAADLVRDTSIVPASYKDREKSMPHELRIDGLVFQASDPNAQAAHDRVVKQHVDALAAAVAQRDNAQITATKAVKDSDAAAARADNAVAELKTVLAEIVKLDGGELTVADMRDPVKRDPVLQAVIEKAAAARASLLVEARKHLGVNEKFDAHVDAKSGKSIPAKSDFEIKKLVVGKLDPGVKLDGRSEDYVQARYDGLIETAAKSTPRAIDQVRAVVHPIEGERVDAVPPTDPAEARARMIARAHAANAVNVRH